VSAARSYSDFVPNRFRDEKPPVLTPDPGTVIITSSGAFVVGLDGKHRPRARAAVNNSGPVAPEKRRKKWVFFG
jgi:hypothetical protein